MFSVLTFPEWHECAPLFSACGAGASLGEQRIPSLWVGSAGAPSLMGQQMTTTNITNCRASLAQGPPTATPQQRDWNLMGYLK